MHKSMATLLVPAILAVALIASPAMAQEKKGEKTSARQQKILIDNKRVRVSESTFKPGDASPMVNRPYRITRVLQGGAMERTHSDGKKERLDWRAGSVFETGPDQSSTRNTGNATVIIYTVVVK